MPVIINGSQMFRIYKLKKLQCLLSIMTFDQDRCRKLSTVREYSFVLNT